MLNIHKKIKIYKKLIITIKLTGEDSDKKNNFNKKDFKNNILFKIIKFFFNKESLFNSLNNKELKLFFSFFYAVHNVYFSISKNIIYLFFLYYTNF